MKMVREKSVRRITHEERQEALHSDQISLKFRFSKKAAKFEKKLSLRFDVY